MNGEKSDQSSTLRPKVRAIILEQFAAIYRESRDAVEFAFSRGRIKFHGNL